MLYCSCTVSPLVISSLLRLLILNYVNTVVLKKYNNLIKICTKQNVNTLFKGVDIDLFRIPFKNI
jgi:hypothetical protein